ncbi:MAG: glycosyltransferase [Anaerolineae bacterium]
MLDNEFPPLGGGTGVVNYHLLHEMAGYPDVWVDLVTSSRSRRDYEIEQFSERIAIYKVPVGNHNIHHSSNRELLRYAWRGLLLSRRLLQQRRYDLSFAFAGVPAGAMSYALNVMAGLPYLVSLQGPDVPGFEARYDYLYPVLKPLLRRIWSNAAVVTAISKEHRCLAHQTMPELDIPIIHNGVDTRVFRPADEPRRRLEANILCVGRLIERKGQHHLLRAFALLSAHCNRPIRLTLVGTGDAEDALYHLAADLGVADAVTFTGFVSRDDMPAVYRQSDIFVLPSQNEGMSIALLEAIASGLPVVVTDTGGTAELVREGINGLVVPWADVPALTDALAMLVQDEQAQRRMGRESRRIVRQFSWPAVAGEYLEVCAQIAARSQYDRETPKSVDVLPMGA